MTLDLLWIDFFLRDRLFGFGIVSVKGKDIHRSLFAIYWNDGELLIDLCWFRIFATFPLWWLKDNERK